MPEGTEEAEGELNSHAAVIVNPPPVTCQLVVERASDTIVLAVIQLFY